MNRLFVLPKEKDNFSSFPFYFLQLLKRKSPAKKFLPLSLSLVSLKWCCSLETCFQCFISTLEPFITIHSKQEERERKKKKREEKEEEEEERKEREKEKENWIIFLPQLFLLQFNFSLLRFHSLALDSLLFLLLFFLSHSRRRKKKKKKEEKWRKEFLHSFAVQGMRGRKRILVLFSFSFFLSFFQNCGH